MRHVVVAAFAAAVLTAGCGEPAHTDQADPAQSGTPQRTVAGPATTPTGAVTAQPVPGTLIVGQHGTQPPKTLWYLRIETTAAQSLFERSYPGAVVAQTRVLAPGQYRVIAWHRPCASTCPTQGEAGLGPLGQVCGTRITVAPRARAAVTVSIRDDGTCSFASG